MRIAALAFVVLLVPAQSSPEEALKRETVYNSLHRQLLPMCPFGAIVDVSESKDNVSCFFSWNYDLDTPPCATLKAKLLAELKSAGVDLAKPDGKVYAQVAAKMLWNEIYEKEAAGKYAALQKRLGVTTPALRIGAAISFRLGDDTRCLTTMGSTKEWCFVSH
jgi:hypothetical protein